MVRRLVGVDYTDTPSAQLSPGGTLVAELTLLLGGILPFLASLFIESFETTEETLAWARDHSVRAEVGTLFGLLAVPFLLGGVLVYWLLTRDASPGFAWIAAVSLTVGYVGLAATQGSQGIAFALASQSDLDLARVAEAIEANTVPKVAELLMTFGGWLFGLLAGIVAFVQSPAAPSAAAFFFLAAPASFLLFDETEIGTGLWLAGSALIAWTIDSQRRTRGSSAADSS